MQLTDEDIPEFAALWQQEFNESLSPGDARHYASALLAPRWCPAPFPGLTETGRRDFREVIDDRC